MMSCFGAQHTVRTAAAAMGITYFSFIFIKIYVISLTRERSLPAKIDIIFNFGKIIFI